MDSCLAEQLYGLSGLTILITGACGGLGTTLAKTIFEAGADVICTDIGEPPGHWRESVLGDVRGLQSISYRSMDVTDEEEVGKVFAELNLKNPLAGLVCCAGISAKGPSVDFSASTVRRILDVNLTGAFLCAREAAKLFQRDRIAGSIVMVASMSGYVSNKGVDTPAYNASKAALHQLARSLAAEWGRCDPPIRVNTLSPGYILTEATLPTLKEMPHLMEAWSSDNVLGRLSKPSEFRAPVLFMLGKGSSFMTGADLRVDGGHCAW